MSSVRTSLAYNLCVGASSMDLPSLIDAKREAAAKARRPSRRHLPCCVAINFIRYPSVRRALGVRVLDAAKPSAPAVVEARTQDVIQERLEGFARVSRFDRRRARPAFIPWRGS